MKTCNKMSEAMYKGVRSSVQTTFALPQTAGLDIERITRLVFTSLPVQEGYSKF